MMMSELIEDSILDGEAVILCPHCGDSCLHHADVEVWDRKCEDSNEVTKIKIADGRAKISLDPRGNPSARRDGLAVHFVCESCGWPSRLTIAQHKGQSFMKLEPYIRRY